eukprot:scaffold311622_cov28-Tisochrysis_lutea.AAC.3
MSRRRRCRPSRPGREQRRLMGWCARLQSRHHREHYQPEAYGTGGPRLRAVAAARQHADLHKAWAA